MDDPKLFIINHYIEGARMIGVLDETAARNLYMVLEFRQMQNEGITVDDIATKLEDKYHVGVKAILKICYQQGEKKESTEKVITEFIGVKRKPRRVHPERKRRK
jgi:hypothetical protein